MKVGEVMTRSVISLAPSDSVAKAARRMIQFGVSGLPVLDRDKLVGIITQGDFLRRTELGTEKPRTLSRRASVAELADEYTRTHGRAVGEVMTRDVVTVGEDTPLEDAVDLMQRRRVRRLPVVNGETLVGLVSRGNLLHAFIVNSHEAGPAAANDAEIRDRLAAVLAAEPWAPLGSIRFRVDHGHVDLEGVVSDERQRLALRVAAENTSGVTAVSDHLELDPAASDALAAGESGDIAVADPWVLDANVKRYRSVLAAGSLGADEARRVEGMLADAEQLLEDRSARL